MELLNVSCLFRRQSTDAGREEMEVETNRLRRELNARCRELEAEKQVRARREGIFGWVWMPTAYLATHGILEKCRCVRRVHLRQTLDLFGRFTLHVLNLLYMIITNHHNWPDLCWCWDWFLIEALAHGRIFGVQ